MSLQALLAEGRPVLIDGGLSTALEELGADLSGELWTARVLRDDPALVLAAHRAFVAAGAQVVTSASYQAPDDLLAASVRAARAAGVLVAASVAPYGASLAGGEEYTGDYEVPAGFHERRLRLLLAAEPDCIAVETQPRLDEAAAIVRLLERLDAPEAWVTFTCRDGERTAHGERIEAAIAAVESPKVVAVGVNCTPPRYVDELLRRARTVTGKPLIAYPNAGRAYDPASKTWSGGEQAWRGTGAQVVGGCCGVGPSDLRALGSVTGTAAARPRRHRLPG